MDAVSIIIFVSGALLGGVLIYVFFKKSTYPMSKIQANFVLRDEYVNQTSALEVAKNTLANLQVEQVKLEAERDRLRLQVDQIKEGLEEQEKLLRLEFQELSNRILDNKGKQMLEKNEAKLNELLNPLKERIKEFEKKVDSVHKEDIKDRAVLNKALEQMMQLNEQMSDDALRLTNALKGDSKFQGDWGEMQLERILTAAGLEEDIHFVKQASLRNDKGELQRPDYIINLPDDKQLVLDAKVSLTAYESYVGQEDKASMESAIKAHKKSLSDHINGLSSKNYQSLYAINQPDYVIMFVPLEPALTLGFKHDSKLFEKAMDKNVVLVSTSTLLATLRTIAYIWKQENQKQNAQQIAWESSKLYDKFVGFMEDLSQIGIKLDDAQEAYEGAFNKLTKSTKKGDTIVGRIENLKKLGAEPSKQLPDQLIN